MTLEWDPNTESDLAGYRLFYGEASGSYTQQTDVGNSTLGSVSNLAAGTTCFFVVKAYNNSGLESGPSNELAYTVPPASGGIPGDTVAPTPTIATPITGSTLSGMATINVNASDNVGVTKVECYLNGTLEGTSSGAPALFAWDTATFPNGSYSIVAKAYDAAGNAGASTLVSVTVHNADATAPTVSITSPVNGAKVSKTVKIYVVAADNSGVTRVELFLDGRLYQSTSTASTYFNWNTTKAARGQHTLQAFAYDAAGNRGASAIVTVTK